MLLKIDHLLQNEYLQCVFRTALFATFARHALQFVLASSLPRVNKLKTWTEEALSAVVVRDSDE